MVVGELSQPVQLLVIGGGPGGYTAAARAAELGMGVVLVEQEELGGVCLNVGCIPSKALITAASHRHQAGTLSGLGFVDTVPAVDLASFQSWKDGVLGRLRDGIGSMLGKVEVVRGTARLLDGRRAAVETPEAVRHFQFDACILATGSRPIELPSLPVDGERVIDSSGALALEEIPDRLVVVGGGVIGLELGTAYAKLGSEVTIVEAAPSIGAGLDPELVAAIKDGLEALNVRVLTDAFAQGVTAEALEVRIGDATEVIPADRILVAVGRRPNTEELQLEEASIRLDERGLVVVDEQLRTTSPRIYAIGDLVRGPALAHKASAEGRITAEFIAGDAAARFDSLVPLVCFTDPEVASIGMTEGEAKAAGIAVVVGKTRFAASGRALTMAEERGFVKVVVERESRVIVGVQLAGPEASELVGAACVAVESALRVDDLLGTVLPHPTLVESLVTAVEAAERRLSR